MKKTTRYRLIEYMKAKKTASTVELAHVLKITASDARYHLASLENEGVVVVVDTRMQGRGRPTQIYMLSKELNRHNLDGLTRAILDVWLPSLQEDKRNADLLKIGMYMITGINKPEGNLTQRLTSAIRYLNNKNYVARWEAHINAPRILITHCPYALVAPKHPEICQIDGFLIGEIIGQAVSRISSVVEKNPSQVQCIFCLDSGSLAIDTLTPAQ
jgi:predicted ArsR family transcriptional regulator